MVWSWKTRRLHLVAGLSGRAGLVLEEESGTPKSAPSAPVRPSVRPKGPAPSQSPRPSRTANSRLRNALAAARSEVERAKAGSCKSLGATPPASCVSVRGGAGAAYGRRQRGAGREAASPPRGRKGEEAIWHESANWALVAEARGWSRNAPLVCPSRPLGAGLVLELTSFRGAK